MTHPMTDSQRQAARLRALAWVIRHRALFADDEVYRQEIARAAEMESEALALERSP